MKNIAVLGTKPHGHWFPIVSWLIRLLEWTKQSHVLLYFPETHMVRHAHFNNIKEQHIDEFMKDNRMMDMKVISFPDEAYDKVDLYSKYRLGKQKGYFKTLFGSIIPQLCKHIFKTRFKNPWYEGTTCSEFVRESLAQGDEVEVSILTKHIPKGTFTTWEALCLASHLSDKY